MNGTLLFSNDNWTTATNKQDITDTGRAPGASQESAVLTTLAPGRYTAIVRGVGATSGVALVEVYDQDSGPGSLLANLSTRSGVGTGNNVMIGGIILTGQKTIIVRALGPTLTQFGVANALNDPALELRNAQGGAARFRTTIGNPARRARKFRRVGVLRLIQPNPPSWSTFQWEITLPLSGELGQCLPGSPYSRSIRNRSVTL
jgi:hypothetical protein